MTEAKEKQPRTTIKSGFIYLFRADNNLYKIGLTINVPKRLMEITALSPVPIYLEHAMATDCMARAEEALHHKFRARRDHGEWFALKPIDVKWIKSKDRFDEDEWKELWDDFFRSRYGGLAWPKK